MLAAAAGGVSCPCDILHKTLLPYPAAYNILEPKLFVRGKPECVHIQNDQPNLHEFLAQ